MQIAVRTPREEVAAVARYYDDTQRLYSNVWSASGVHYGFWDDHTRSHEQSIQNLNRVVAQQLALPHGARVLDAGCGIGGTCRYLVDTAPVHAVGITLSRDQTLRAQRATREHRQRGRVRYLVADYLSTCFASESFDGVYAIESCCYARDKGDFVREAYRLLRPGGRLVVADGFLARRATGSHARRLQRFLDGLALPNLAWEDAFEEALWKAGFQVESVLDQQALVRRSANRIAALSWIGLAVCAIPCALGWFPRTWWGHGLAGVSQRRLWDDGVVVYRVFTGSKPGGALGRIGSPGPE